MKYAKSIRITVKSVNGSKIEDEKATTKN
jgi:hypothetical protein